MHEVVAIESKPRMGEAEYRRARAELRATYGETARQAGAHADQALATLFVRSGWTEAQLAAVEGKKPRYIAYRLTFGRFLAFCTTVQNPNFTPIKPQLTERRFRKYWQETKDVGGGNMRHRFLAVQQALIENFQHHGSSLRHSKVGHAVRISCADGQWHRLGILVARVQETVPAATADDITAVADLIVQRRTYGLTGERRKGAKECQYRFVPSGQVIPLGAFMHDIGPLLEGLEAEGKKNSVTASPSTVAYIAFQIRQLIERLTTERQ